MLVGRASLREANPGRSERGATSDSGPEGQRAARIIGTIACRKPTPLSVSHIQKAVPMNTSPGTTSHEDPPRRATWQDMFDDDTRRELIEADRDAWRTVVALLMTIVIIGLCLGFLGAAMSVWL